MSIASSLQGVVIGMVGTSGVTEFAKWQMQKRTKFSERAEKISDLQRELCAQFICLIDKLRDAAREMHSAMDVETSEDLLRPLHSTYIESWTSYYGGTPKIRFELECPSPLLASLDELKVRAKDYANAVDDLYLSRESSSAHEFKKKSAAAGIQHDDFKEKRDKFMSKCRAEFKIS